MFNNMEHGALYNGWLSDDSFDDFFYCERRALMSRRSCFSTMFEAQGIHSMNRQQVPQLGYFVPISLQQLPEKRRRSRKR